MKYEVNNFKDYLLNDKKNEENKDNIYKRKLKKQKSNEGYDRMKNRIRFTKEEDEEEFEDKPSRDFTSEKKVKPKKEEEEDYSDEDELLIYLDEIFNSIESLKQEIVDIKDILMATPKETPTKDVKLFNDSFVNESQNFKSDVPYTDALIDRVSKILS